MIERFQGMIDTPTDPFADSKADSKRQNETPLIREVHVSPAELLESYKQQMHERSEARGELKALGEIRVGSDPNLWVGKSSVAKRVESNELTQDEIREGLSSLARSYVPVTKGARKRCVEDRGEEGYDDFDPKSYGMPLGPQVQGGTPDEALAARLATGYEDGDTLEQDTIDTAHKKPSQFAPGAHTGRHATEDATDCGSIDNEAAKVDLYIDDEAAPTIFAKTDAIFGLADCEVPVDAAKTLQLNGKELSKAGQKYFGKLAKLLDTVHSANADGVAKVAGDHSPVFVVANFVKGDTLHTSHYAAHTGGKIKAFNLDVWNIFDECEPQEAYNLIAAATATLMRITDGSVILVARQPRD